MSHIIRAAMLREGGRPLVVEDLCLAPPHAGEVRVRVAAAGVCHSDLHLADGNLGERWPIVLGHEGAGVVEEIGPGVEHVQPGDPVAFCFVAPCGTCRYCHAGLARHCEISGNHAHEGTLLDGTTRLSFTDGRPVKHFNFVSCFAEQAVLPAQSVVPLPRDLPLWQAALIGCGVVTGIGAVRNAARVRSGESVAVVGVGGVGQQVVAGARLAGADPIIAIDRDAAKLALAKERGATHTVQAGDPTTSADPVQVVREITGGVDHAFEVIGRPDTIRLAWDLLRPGATAIVVGLAPRGVEVSLPAIELLSEKGIRGCFYGSGDPADDLFHLAGLIASHHFAVDDVVSHTTDLDGIEEAFARLRLGEGARTVAIIDPALAGRPAE